MKIKLILLSLVYYLNIFSSNIHIYKIASENQCDPSELKTTDKTPILNTDLNYLAATALNSIIVKNKNYVFSHNIKLANNSQEQITKTDKNNISLSCQCLIGKGNSAFLAQYLRLNIDCVALEPIYIFATGSFNNELYSNKIEQLLKKSTIPLHKNIYYNHFHLKEILESPYEETTNTFIDLQNIEIGPIALLGNKILNTIRYCSKKKINNFYFLLPKKNQALANIIFSIYEHAKIISGYPIFISNTKEALEFCQKLNTQNPPSPITTTSPLDSTESTQEIQIQFDICQYIKNFIINTVNINNQEKDTEIKTKRELFRCIEELVSIINNYDLSNLSDKKTINELYLLLLKKIKTNSVNSLIDELIMMIITIEEIYFKKNKTDQNTSIENEIIENIYCKSSEEKNKIQLQFLTTLMNSLINMMLIKEKVKEIKSEKIIKSLISKLKNFITANEALTIDFKYIETIYQIINNIYRNMDTFPVYTTSLINFFLTLQTIYFNQHKKTAPLSMPLERSEWHGFFAAPITTKNLFTYIDMYSQSLNNYENTEAYKQNKKEKINNLILILNSFCFEEKTDPKKNILLISFILFLLERLSTIDKNDTYFINDVIELCSLFQKGIINQKNIYDRITKIMSENNYYQNQNNPKEEESYIYGLKTLSKYLNKKIITFSNNILKNILYEYIKEFLQNNISFSQLILVYKYIEQYETCNNATITHHHDNIRKDIQRITKKKDMLIEVEKKIKTHNPLKINEYKNIKMLYNEGLITLRELVNLIYRYIIEENSSDKNLYITKTLFPDLNTYLNCCMQYNKNNNIKLKQ